MSYLSDEALETLLLCGGRFALLFTSHAQKDPRVAVCVAREGAHRKKFALVVWQVVRVFPTIETWVASPLYAPIEGGGIEPLSSFLLEDLPDEGSWGCMEPPPVSGAWRWSPRGFPRTHRFR